MKLKAQDIDGWLYTAYLLLNTSFFFLDPTLYVPKLVVVAGTWLLLAAIAFRRRLHLRPIFLLICLYLVLLQVAKLNGAERYGIADALYPAGLVHMLFLMYLLDADRGIVLRSIDWYLTIAVCLNLPSILFQLGLLLNLPVNYSLIHLGSRDFFYRNYHNLAIFADYEVLEFGKLSVARLAGVFEEAGMLGTYVAVLLGVDLIAFPRRKWRHLALFVLGIMSLSFAFYVFLVPLFFYFALKYGKKALILVVLMIGLTAAVIPRDLAAAFFYLVYSKLEFTKEGVFAADSRQLAFAARYADYLRSASPVDLAFGHGAKSNQFDAAGQYSSYQGIVYESGYTGLALVVVFVAYFLIWPPLKNGQYSTSLLTVFPVLSLYQRPDMLSPHFLVAYAAVFLVLGGSANGRRPLLPLSAEIPKPTFPS